MVRIRVLLIVTWAVLLSSAKAPAMQDAPSRYEVGPIFGIGKTTSSSDYAGSIGGLFTGNLNSLMSITADVSHVSGDGGTFLLPHHYHVYSNADLNLFYRTKHVSPFAMAGLGIVAREERVEANCSPGSPVFSRCSKLVHETSLGPGFGAGVEVPAPKVFAVRFDFNRIVLLLPGHNWSPRDQFRLALLFRLGH